MICQKLPNPSEHDFTTQDHYKMIKTNFNPNDNTLTAIKLKTKERKKTHTSAIKTHTNETITKIPSTTCKPKNTKTCKKK